MIPSKIRLPLFVTFAALCGLGAPAAYAAPLSAIRHLVVVIQENHSFDSYFGRYCRAKPGSNPACTAGPDCCEAGPDREPGRGDLPVTLTDAENAGYDPNHSQRCELMEINGGKMDRFTNNPVCGNPKNFAYANQASAGTYWKLAAGGALADRYFQPLAGASSSNDMYFARAQYVFTDNDVEPESAGSLCGDANSNRKLFTDPTIGDLLAAASVSWAFYAEGYGDTLRAVGNGQCPKPSAGCPAGVDAYPCIYDPSDNPFQYYVSSRDNPATERDYSAFARDLAAGTLPAVSFVKSLGYRTEHPACSTISEGEKFVTGVVNGILASPFAADTLILVTMDESGGFFDHIAPPPASAADGKPYGPRLPLLALGKFARPGFVSHAVMEHSSILRFIEWNWLGGVTGQLHGRDAVVNNIGSLLDPAVTGAAVPAR